MLSFSRLVAAVAIACSIAGGASAADAPVESEVSALNRILASGGFQQCDRIRDRLVRATADPAFDGLASGQRRTTLFALLACSPEGAPGLANAAGRLEPIAVERHEIFAAHYTLMTDARRRDDIKAYLRHLGAIIDADPALIADWEPDAFFWALRKTRDDPAAKLELLTRLRQPPWSTDSAKDASANGWALSQAQLLMETGDATKAGILLEGATATFVLLQVAQDRRFAPLWPALEQAGRFDWTRVAEAELALTRAQATRRPESLEPIATQIDALRAMGRYDEALALGDAYAVRLDKGERFDDANTQRAWLLNNHAYTLYDLGRFDDADRVMKSAQGRDGVSQRINRAELLSNAGKPAQALEVLSEVKEKQSSPYGLMWRDAGLVCARFRLGDRAGAEALLPSMRERWKENAAALTRALICLDALDEAAALYVRRLEDPAERAGALEAFRVGRPPPVPPPALVEFEARRAKVLARPEVQAALAKWGRPLTLPLAGTYWGAL